MLCSSSSSVPPEIGPFSTGGTIGSLGAARWLQASLPAAQKPAWLLLAPWDDEASRSRFVRRASRWTRLSHPGAMKLFDFDADPSYGFYLAFDAQEAISSEAYLKTEGQMAPERLVRSSRLLAGALAEAHALGLRYGKIGLDNVFVHDEGARLAVDLEHLLGDAAEGVDVRDLGRWMLQMLTGGQEVRRLEDLELPTLAWTVRVCTKERHGFVDVHELVRALKFVARQQAGRIASNHRLQLGADGRVVLPDGLTVSVELPAGMLDTIEPAIRPESPPPRPKSTHPMSTEPRAATHVPPGLVAMAALAVAVLFAAVLTSLPLGAWLISTLPDAAGQLTLP